MAMASVAHRVIEWLRVHGAVYSADGRATTRLAAALQVDNAALGQVLRMLDASGHVVRTMTAKRCYRIALPEHHLDQCQFCAERAEPCAIHR